MQQAARMLHRLRIARQRDQLHRPATAHAGARPDGAQRVGHAAEHRPLQAHREVEARRLAPAVALIEAVVDQVDAADEADRAVDQAQLEVRAAQLAGLDPAPPSVQGAEHGQLRADRGKACLQWAERLQRAEAVDHDVQLHAARRRGAQRIEHRLRRGIVVEDVAGEPDVVPGVLDRRAHRREQLGAAAQQLDPVAAAEQRAALRCMLAFGRAGGRPDGYQLPRHAAISSATIGRWSDMRAQLLPRGTKVDTQRRPRM